MAVGTVTLVPPNDLIMATGDRRVIDGLELVFQMAPETEAPAEMHIYIPALKALNLAENATHNFHNLLPFRGAQVRDPLAWSKYINEAIEMWGGEAEVLMGQHHWPVWGNARVLDYMKVQRDLYKYVHDQTIRLMNMGLNAQEIAEALELPKSIAGAWHARGYYGAVRHNAKAIYQRYLGWYDGNPANLDPLPPVATGRKMIEYMGGIDAAVARARGDFEKGEYRFVAQVMSHAVFADPGHQGARALLADAFEQLGYLTESATWRNAYLFGAHELRNGMPNVPGRTPVSPDTMRALRVGQFFDTLAVRLNGPKAEGRRIVVNWRFTDTGEQYVLTLENATLNHVGGRQDPNADATLTLARPVLDAVMARQSTFRDEIAGGRMGLAGNAAKLVELMGLVEESSRMFEIVEPRKAVE
jgi:alkyl sulfatase BDS1-like metallo-beta-lactamase superfamily hydrolase